MKNLKKEIINHYNLYSYKRLKSKKKYSYFHSLIENYFKFGILDNSTVLEIGCGTGDLLNFINPSFGVGIDISDKIISIAKNQYPNLEFYCTDIEGLDIDYKFDYIILSGVIGEFQDIQLTFNSIKKFCNSETKLIISYYNKLWEPILNISEKFKLKTPQLRQNWLTKNDLLNLIKLSSFELIKNYNKILLPIRIPILNLFFNNFLANIPFFRSFALISFVHIKVQPTKKREDISVSIIIPAKNEKMNIENTIKRIPDFGKDIEIIFVEGNSKDFTYEEILRVKQKYSDKKIISLKQNGKGKGNAVEEGFDIAKGDLLIILDADLTVPPEDLPKFYEAIIEDKAGLVNGSRFVYPLEKDSMRFLNMLGNKFFTNILSYAIDQKLTDTLCGTKVILRKDYLKIKKNKFFFGDFDPFGDFNLIFGAAKLGIKILDLPIRYQEREYGTTQISRFTHGLLLIKMTIFALRKIKFF